MEFLMELLRLMDTKGPEPGLYGWYHILWLLIVVVATVCLCRLKPDPRKTLLVISLVVMVLEIYKQINYSFSYDGSITFSYQWYAFPFQFCSTPMYIGLLAGLTKPGKLHDSLCAYLASFSLFAGLCVMVYPGDVYVDTVGINIQTMICHGSMVVQGVYLLHCGYVRPERKTLLRAAGVFSACVAVAMVLNEVAHATGLLEEHTFNMFFISPYCAPSLPVYSLVQQVVPFPISLVIYIIGFSAAAGIMLLAAHLIHAGHKKAHRARPVAAGCKAA